MRSLLRMVSSGGVLIVVGLLACTYWAAEDRAVAYTVRLPNTRTFFAAVHHERFRPATGLNAFPNGGTPDLDSVPARHQRRGSRVAPEPGELRYMRMPDAHLDTIKARFEYPDGAERSIFAIHPEGELTPVDGRPSALP